MRYRAPHVQMAAGPLNGYLTRASNRANPTTDKDHSPRLFPQYNGTGGQFDVQLNNGLRRRIGTGLRLPVSYLYAAVPRVPGQQRDNQGGFHKHGIDPLSYQTLFDNGPGAQPANPGGPRKIAGDTFYNPGTC